MRARLRRLAARLHAAHTGFNFDSVAPHLAPGARVLDIGAGTCLLGQLLIERQGCAVTNVDVVDHNLTAQPLVRFDGRTVPVDGAAYDAVLLMYVLHHARDDLALLGEARRACRPGGRVLIAEDRFDSLWQRLVTVGFHLWLLACTGMGWRGRFRRLEAWRARFAEAGLAVDEVRPLGRHLGRRLWPENVLFVLRPGPRPSAG